MTDSVNPADGMATERSGSGRGGLLPRRAVVDLQSDSLSQPATTDKQSVAQRHPFGDDYMPGHVYSVKPVKNDEAWQIFAQINDWIRFADAKAAALLATGGVLGGLLVSATPHTMSTTPAGIARIATFTLAVAAVAFSVLMSLLALQPRLGRRENATSLIYFDHIARRFRDDAQGFVEALIGGRTAATHEYDRDLGHQIWANSRVARRKFRHVTSATWLLGAAMLGSGATALLSRV